MKKLIIPALAVAMLFSGCASDKKEVQQEKETPFIWEGANLYFLLTDRFNNGDESNDLNFERTKETGKLRGFEGGDIRGIIQKIDEGYFNDLGINAIWFTPVVEQIHDATDEGTGNTYAFHGYWAKDWTKLDPNFGTEKDLAELVEKAHSHGIRIMLDGVINHTGPVTETDTVWESSWVRTEPQCKYDNYENTTACTLVKNLPDIRTESDEEVALPEMLVTKWKAEGRYEQEVKELDSFFERTGYPRAPKYYIIKWLTDYIRDYGVDAYRADTVKHLGEDVWAEFGKQCDAAFNEWKQNNPEKVLDENDFFTLAEVYNYGISGGKYFEFSDKKVNYYDNGFDALINFQMKWDVAQKAKEEVFSQYSQTLQTELKGNTIVNYLTSHDDGSPFDKQREKTYEAATMLMLTPGISQVYYGDETARPLNIAGTEGDATLRSFMNWEDVNKPETKALLQHWQKLGKFREKHAAVGAGVHTMLSESPYVFKRTYTNGDYNDAVVVGLDLPKGVKTITVGDVFADGEEVHDAYSDKTAKVENGAVQFDTAFGILLIEKTK